MADKPRQMTIYDFLTEAQVQQALDLYKSCQDDLDFTKKCREQIIEPAMAEINRKLGQENDAAYLSYCVLYVFQQAAAQRATKDRRRADLN